MFLPLPLGEVSPQVTERARLFLRQISEFSRQNCILFPAVLHYR